MHEQSRKDRDDYVTINWDNIKDGKASQFSKCEHCDLQNSPYDFKSCMHYGPTSFQSDEAQANGLTTIDAKNGETFGQRNGFSALDIKAINDLYCGKLKVYKINLSKCNIA